MQLDTVGLTFLAILSCTHRRCWTGCKPCPWPLSRIASCFAVHDLFWALRGIYHVWAYTYLLASSFVCRHVFMHVWYCNVLALSFQLTWRDLLASQPISFQQVISYHLYRLNSLFAMSLGNVIFTAIKIIQPMVRSLKKISPLLIGYFHMTQLCISLVMNHPICRTLFNAPSR